MGGTITNTIIQEVYMISVGIDVSKGKSTVCILKPYGEIISSPYDVMHTAGEMDLFVQF